MWIACYDCDAGFSTMEAALAAGWTDIEEDEGLRCTVKTINGKKVVYIEPTLGWTHLGYCPECQEEEKKDVKRWAEADKETYHA